MFYRFRLWVMVNTQSAFGYKQHERYQEPENTLSTTKILLYVRETKLTLPRVTLAYPNTWSLNDGFCPGTSTTLVFGPPATRPV